MNFRLVVLSMGLLLTSSQYSKAEDVTINTENIEKIIEQAVAIQKSYEVLPDLLRSSQHESSTGFLISSYSYENFISFLNEGSKFLINYDDNRDVTGYLLATTGLSFITRHPQTKIQWLNSELQNKYSALFESGNFCYLDQIAVRSDGQRKGIAYSLHSDFEKQINCQLIITAVLREPVKNLKSHLFFDKNSYIHVGDFYSENLKGIRNVRSSVLLKETNKWN